VEARLGGRGGARNGFVRCRLRVAEPTAALADTEEEEAGVWGEPSAAELKLTLPLVLVIETEPEFLGAAK
jgi:hypothetical protein